MDTGSGPDRHRLNWNGEVLELAARRAGVRTVVTLYRDGREIAEGGGIGRVMLPLPRPERTGPAEGEDAPKPPTVLAVAVAPGRLAQAFLLVPRAVPGDTGSAGSAGSAEDGDGERGERGRRAEGGDRRGGVPAEVLDELPEGLAKLVGFAAAERHRFEPPPGTFAGRLLAFERGHPKLWASRHVVLATAKVVGGLLGVAMLFDMLLGRIIGWILERLPDIDAPDVPLPEVNLPSIPWPDIPLPDLPDVALPGWMRAVLATAKYWVPILIAIGVAVEEVRRRRGRDTEAGRDAGADRAARRSGMTMRTGTPWPGEVPGRAGAARRRASWCGRR
ncbi:hypothetical protein [Thermomonospora cellulosilytica]|uniref:Uncharacterized protein n=1 Tax=Thermomonospora cellulosilytica TaxID=1411118 RepID=A0A7W3MVD4_9ACTN|nr:hypothetical protein [Thermomonospora cellulosilytica]MBA9002575.1 hypothetical protein [Thermomonospora cellulosilytica]